MTGTQEETTDQSQSDAVAKKATPKGKLPDGHYPDDHFRVDQAIAHAEQLVSQPSWLAKVALRHAGHGDSVTADEMASAVSELLEHPLDADSKSA